jgi:OmpA-OmpF porin, OOP family
MDKRLALSTFAAFALTAALAARADVQPGFYAGASVGSTTIDDDGFGSAIDDSDTGFKLFGGYTFNDNFAIEASYFDLGEANGSFDDPFFGPFDFDVGVSGLNVSAVGRVPLTQTFSLFGKLGFASYDLDVSFNGPGFVSGSGSESETDLTYGVGGALSFAEQWEVRVEFEAISVDDGDANMLSVGAMYRF